MCKTIIKMKSGAWFALADAEHCRLLCCHVSKFGLQHVDEYETLDNTFPEHEHQRSQSGEGMTREVDEKERRFTGEVMNWLKERSEQHDIHRLTIYATPRILGLLRKIDGGIFKDRFTEIEANLMRFTVGQLAEHRLVSELVNGT